MCCGEQGREGRELYDGCLGMSGCPPTASEPTKSLVLVLVANVETYRAPSGAPDDVRCSRDLQPPRPARGRQMTELTAA